MSEIRGYFLELHNRRMVEFFGSDTFAEPVDEFVYSRNLPLPCFIFSWDYPSSEFHITHICLGRRGNMAGTGLRRLNLTEIYEIKTAIEGRVLLSHLSSLCRKKIEEKIRNSGGLVPPAALRELIGVVSKIAPDTASLLEKYSQEREKRIRNISPAKKVALGEQKEAVATALAIAGIDRSNLSGWDFAASPKFESFLDGLQQVRLREDQMLVNDLNKLPGYQVIKSTPHNSVVFENDDSKLTVILANRLPLEEQFGVDLIYFNEAFSCFLMVQYKAMEKEGAEHVFRFPNDQLKKEIERMDAILRDLKSIESGRAADGYRLNENPFFLKICPRIVFDPDNIGLVPGMYLPLDYWRVISEHPSMKGGGGGSRISYQNVRRYFDNTEFLALASAGWVGSNREQSEILKSVISSTIESGRAVVLAINEIKGSLRRRES